MIPTMPSALRLAVRTAAGAMLALATLAPNAAAQGNISVTFVGAPNGSNPNALLSGLVIGPYNLQRNNPTSIFQAYCIDFDNTVSAGQAWTSRVVVDMATLATSQTDFNAFVRVLGTSATAGTLGNSFNTTNTTEWIRRLRAAAYLADQMVGTPSPSWDETQYAIWTLFATNVPNPSDLTAGESLRTTALTFAQNNPNSFGNWRVLIDANAYNTAYTGSFAQAYITTSNVVVPEPSTYALMATGLAALGIAARRRSQRGTRPATPDRS